MGIKIFLFFAFFFIVNCQNEGKMNKEINEFNAEFYECMKEFGIYHMNNDLEKKINETKDEGIKNILNSFRKKMEKKEDEKIVKECRKKALQNMNANIQKILINKKN